MKSFKKLCGVTRTMGWFERHKCYVKFFEPGLKAPRFDALASLLILCILRRLNCRVNQLVFFASKLSPGSRSL